MENVTEKAVAFVRVNNISEDQKTKLEEQIRVIRAYASSNNVQVINTISCTSQPSAREKLKEVLEYCKANPDVRQVLVKDPSRLSRSIEEYYYWKALLSAADVKLITATQDIDETPAAKFMSELLNHFTRYDNDSKSKMVKENMQRRSKMGYSVSRPPFGYTKGTEAGVFEISPEGNVLRTYIKMFLGGDVQLQEFKNVISKVRYSGLTGKTSYPILSDRAFKNMVMNPFYAGVVCYQGECHKGLHEPLVSEEEHKKLKELLSK